MNGRGAGASGSVLRARLFGALEIEDGARVLGPGDLGGVRPKQVLEILLAARGHRVPTDRIAELLWAQERPANAAGSLQTFISVLRRHLVSGRERARRIVVTEAEAYRVATELVDLDLDRFDELIERSAREPTRVARRLLEQALALVRGEVLEDEPYATWAQDLRGTYQARVLGAHLDAADAGLAEADYAAALDHGEAAIGLDRFSERAHRTAMLALYALGRQHEALDIYRRFRARLDEELGLEPTAETRGLETAILRHEDVQSLVPRPIMRPAEAASPRAIRLLGRTTELDELERAAREALNGSLTVILVEGETGVGKTRLLDELAMSLVGVRVGRASASQLERHLPYVPLAAAVREALTRAELDECRRPALGQVLPEVARRQSHEYGELDALEALAELIAEHSPLALLIDDLQWADQATIAALSYLQRRGAGVAAVIVAAARSEDVSATHAVRRLRPDTVVLLEPLTPAELAPLGMPDLHASTGGNPRFVSEAVANGGNGTLSPTLEEALLAHARAEGAWAYRVLAAASVLEQPFAPESLASLLGADAADLTEELERLCERRILRVDGYSFRFRYELLRQVLCASLSPARRRLLRQRRDQSIDKLGSLSRERPARRLRGLAGHG
jgi:DNA-binding SARP family transcriptional activator